MPACHGVQPATADELKRRLHATGLRLTGPRLRILGALRRLGHATPEELAADLPQDGGGGLPASTIYRNLESLAAAGMVRHSHLDHGAPSYHLEEHGDHLHLFCRECESVTQADRDLASELVRNLRGQYGFEAEVTHMAIHGRCAACAVAAAPQAQPPKSTAPGRAP